MPQQTHHAASCTVGTGPAPGILLGRGGGLMAANRALWLKPPSARENWGRGQWVGGHTPPTAWEGMTVPRMGVALAGMIKGTRGGSELGEREVGTREKQPAREGSSLCAPIPRGCLPSSFPGGQTEFFICLPLSLPPRDLCPGRGSRYS